MTTKPRASKFRIKRAGGLRSGNAARATEHEEAAPRGPKVVRRPVE